MALLRLEGRRIAGERMGPVQMRSSAASDEKRGGGDIQCRNRAEPGEEQGRKAEETVPVGVGVVVVRDGGAAEAMPAPGMRQGNPDADERDDGIGGDAQRATEREPSRPANLAHQIALVL
jgi:hypothetical protein